MILNVTSVIQCDLITLTQTTARIFWLCWHQEDQKVPRSTPRCHRKIPRIASFGKLRSKGQNIWILFVPVTLSKPEEGRRENQRSVCRVLVRHPDSLWVLLIFLPGEEVRHDLNGRSWLPAFWQVAEASSIFRRLRKPFVCYFFAMRLRVCVCYMSKFGAGRLLAPRI